MIKRAYHKIRDYCPFFTIIALGIGLLTGILYAVALLQTPFADFFNRTISTGVRIITATLTKIFPFSVAEGFLLFSPVIFVLLLTFCVRLSRKNKKEAIQYLLLLVGILILVYSLFLWSFGIAYKGSTLEQKLNFDRQPVSAENLEHTSLQLVNAVNELTDKIAYQYGSFSVMPYGLNELNQKLDVAYEKASQKYSFLPVMHTRIKPIILSEPMTYTHISGVYTYFTGEANLNTNFPPYTLPYTAAHELAHQRGIAREDEANFMAFLVCMESDDPYIRYSAYLNVYEYCASALYSADKDRYFTVLDQLDNRARYELIAYQDFFEKYRDSKVAEISDTMNDTYLKAQGQTEGSNSYGRVVDLAVAYYRKEA